ncbi:MAG: 1,4-dihydroxy-2-naphthoate polyprenyltransferase [Actinomycetota bacterium]|nr:1,4-dihydroxy-2-naphthoate polyprenyltransferase [Actinomycetota bacterium]
MRLWYLGARPRTLGASVAPVLVGTAVGVHYGELIWWRALLCLVLAAALQIGVNYANDYSDGVRGVDRERKGPLRLTASGLVAPASVKRAAILSFAVGAVAGLVLAVCVSLWLLVVGAASIAAAALYSGGPKPYASSGMGEVSVLVFFGFVATCGSAFVQLERVPWLAVGASVPVGLLACAILLVNNLRDIVSDTSSGKRTLAVRIGELRTVRLYQASVVASFAAVPGLALVAPGALLGLAAAPLALPPLKAVRVGASPPVLVACLVATATMQLAFSILLAAGLAWT